MARAQKNEQMAPCRESARIGCTTRTGVEGEAAEHVPGPDPVLFSFEMAMSIRFRTVAPVKDRRSTSRRPRTCGRERKRAVVAAREQWVGR